jgi:hypothetical protein
MTAGRDEQATTERDQGDLLGALPLDRAEEVVDRVGRQIGQTAALAGARLLGLAARAREEAEDIWAEAQSRRGGQDS